MTEVNEAGNRGPGQQGQQQHTNEKKGKDKKYRERVKLVNDMYKGFCEQPEFLPLFKTYVEKRRKSIGKTLEFKLGKNKDICGEPKITKKLEAKYRNRIENSSKNDATNELSEEDAFDCLCELELWMVYLAARIGNPSEPDPVSPGFRCKTRPPQESCNTEVISKMQEMQEIPQQMQDNMDTKIQGAAAAAPEEFGFCQQTNAVIVFPAEHHHNPLGKQGGTNAAAGSCGSGGATLGMVVWFFYQNDGTNKPETRTGYLEDIVRDYCMQSSTTQTTPLTVDAMNSTRTGAMGTSFERAKGLKRKGEEELDGNHRNKRPAAPDNTQQNYCQPAASTNEGTQIQMTGAAHDKEAWTSSRAPLQVAFETSTYDELGQGSIEEPSLCDPLLEFCGWPEITEKFKAFREKYRPSPKFQHKACEDFCKEPGIADGFKDDTEKRGQFGEQLKMLEGPLMDGIDADALPNSPGQEIFNRSMMQRIRMDEATEADNLEWT